MKGLQFGAPAFLYGIRSSFLETLLSWIVVKFKTGMIQLCSMSFGYYGANHTSIPAFHLPTHHKLKQGTNTRKYMW